MMRLMLVGRAQQQMVMVGHQGIGRDLGLEHVRDGLEQVDEGLIVLGIQEDRFMPAATIHDVVLGVG